MNSTRVATIWLAVLRAREPITYADIAAALPELSHNQRAPALKAAYRLGYLERTGRGRPYSYAVTAGCNVPPGIRIFEVLEATA